MHHLLCWLSAQVPNFILQARAHNVGSGHVIDQLTWRTTNGVTTNAQCKMHAAEIVMHVPVVHSVMPASAQTYRAASKLLCFYMNSYIVTVFAAAIHAIPPSRSSNYMPTFQLPFTPLPLLPAPLWHLP